MIPANFHEKQINNKNITPNNRNMACPGLELTFMTCLGWESCSIVRTALHFLGNHIFQTLDSKIHC